MTGWANPSWLWLLAGLPVILLLLTRSDRRYQRRLAAVTGGVRADGAGGGMRPAVGRRWRLAIRLAAFALLVTAGAGPRLGYIVSENQRRGHDVVVLFDVSASMLSADVQPNRLERARRDIIDLLAGLGGSRVGLVVFAGQAYLHCPLTEDLEALRLFLAEVRPDLIRTQGTDIGAALKVGMEALAAGGAGTPEGRALLLVTDGEDLAGQGDSTVAAVRKRGVTLHTLAVGSEAGGPVPLEGGGLKKDGRGQVVISRPDFAALDRLAAAAGGLSLRSVPGGEDSDRLIAGIRGARAQDLGSGPQKIWHERFRWFVLPALLLLVLEPLLTGPPAVAGHLILLLGLGVGLPAGAARAQAGLATGSAPEDPSVAAWRDREVNDPDDARHPYNRGVAAYQSGRFQEAAEAFGRAAREGDEALRRKSWFNRGNALAQSGDLDGAVASYEQALALNQDDSAARENLEFVKNLQKQSKSQPPPSGQPPQKPPPSDDRSGTDSGTETESSTGSESSPESSTGSESSPESSTGSGSSTESPTGSGTATGSASGAESSISTGAATGTQGGGASDEQTARKAEDSGAATGSGTDSASAPEAQPARTGTLTDTGTDTAVAGLDSGSGTASGTDRAGAVAGGGTDTNDTSGTSTGTGTYTRPDAVEVGRLIDAIDDRLGPRTYRPQAGQSGSGGKDW